MRSTVLGLAVLGCIAVGGIVEQDVQDAHGKPAATPDSYQYTCTVTVYTDGTETDTECTEDSP